jgi:plastocyanin
MSTAAGTTLTFRNDDSATHTVTDLDHPTPAFDSGNLAFKDTFLHAFATAGTYRVYCTIHGQQMQATIMVQ